MTEKLRYLEDRWDENVASKLDAAELLRYRSNLLGSDLRITNFGGGNTSSKLAEADPIDRSKKNVLWIKGSGGDIGSIQRKGFATLYLDKLHSLTGQYRGVQFEDEMVDFYPICTFGNEWCGGVDRYAAAWIFAVRTRRSLASGLGDRAGGCGERRGENGGVQSDLRAQAGVAAVAAAGI